MNEVEIHQAHFGNYFISGNNGYLYMNNAHGEGYIIVEVVVVCVIFDEALYIYIHVCISMWNKHKNIKRQCSRQKIFSVDHELKR